VASIIEWKRTTTQYVAILQAADRFDPTTIRPVEKNGPETILAGRLRGTDREEWYALAYDRNELDFDEARDLARARVDAIREAQRGPLY
jgi:hypothetical protein